jgi:membrane fusion protein (multidrug efflux system)
MQRRISIANFVLVVGALGTAAALASWKADSLEASRAASAQQPEPMESVTVASAEAFATQSTTSAIGTVLAKRSVTVRNELEGTVEHATLAPGRVVDAGALLVQLDVAVERAELAALEAQASLARTALDRYQQANREQAVSAFEVDQAQAELDIANAQIARTLAVIERKTIRAPFRARVGLADVHRGQYLDAGSHLTTLQSVDDEVHVDFAIAQAIAASLDPGSVVNVYADADPTPLAGSIVAVDARVDPTTRTALVRASVPNAGRATVPGASVRVVVPVGEARSTVVVPASALRRGPQGDHVFVIETDEQGQQRAHVRPVEAGGSVGNRVEIRSGLEVGEQVAAGGSFKLREAVLVAVQPDQIAALAPGH